MKQGQQEPTSKGGIGPEVPETAKRHTFDAAYKLQILEEADNLTGLGQRGELLRREVCIRLTCHPGVTNEMKAL